MLDPTAKGNLSEYEKQVVRDAQNVGTSTDATEALTDKTESMSRSIKQTINAEALAEIGSPGGESDLTGGIANLDETTRAKVKQNEYNR